MNEIQNRMERLRDVELSESITKKLAEILKDNPYAKFFRSLKDLQSIEDARIHLATNVQVDQRVYNLPGVDQVAAIWIEGNNNNIQFKRDIVVHAYSGKRHRIQHYFSCYDSLQYPLLLPNGEAGWHQDIKRNVKQNHDDGSNKMSTKGTSNIQKINNIEDIMNNKNQGISKRRSPTVSCREYYCFKLQIRPSTQSILLLAGRLFQQYVVDMYIKLETTRLDFYKTQQSQIRSELYQGIVDFVNAEETREDKVGKRVVLPSTFIGGLRDMRRRYLDAMALVQHYGKPDLFITMTCNAEWKEIREELMEGQQSHDRPDLTLRVFRGKLMDLKDQIVRKEIFGKVVAFLYVIEFQKRGLPHMHMLVILKKDFKITNADQYDNYVRTEIPNIQTNPTLHSAVVKHMMHGPCGEDNKKCPCMINGKCKFHYPRQFSSKTMQGKDAYPIYKRRDDGTQVTVRKKTFDNRWVVPYNPYLLLRYNCHINVEICSGLKAVKYLYKYIYKGHDRAAVYISHDGDNKSIDEIRDYQDARWVSAQEALWRIYDFRLNEIYPPVINLQLHLPNMQCVSYLENQNLKKLIHWDHVSKTMLTEYFHMCQASESARKLLYKEFPEHYAWDKQLRIWKERKKGMAVSRIVGANPREGERYYLRLLLNHVRGPTSFESLLIVNGKRVQTFKDLAQERGLLESDDSVIECLDEAASFEMPYAFRRLFATILVYCEPVDVRKLWEKYSHELLDDYRKDEPENVEYQRQQTLRDIKVFLESMGKQITMYDLPKIKHMPECGNNCYIKEIVDEKSIVVSDEDIQVSLKLNEDQKIAYDIIVDRIVSNKSGVFFIDGPGGTGKIFLYRALLATIRSRNMIAIATATSGVATSIMLGGRTTHSRFNIPLEANESSVCNISKQSNKAELIRQAKVIIWDEAPMAKKTTIEAVDKTFRDIMDNPKPFGGKVVVFGGDFRQVLLVVPRATRQQTINESLVKSYLWNKMEKIQLTKNMKAQSDTRFAEYLLKIGNGTELSIEDDYICLPTNITVTGANEEDSVLQLLNIVYPDLKTHATLAEYMTSRAILSTTNEYVDQINERMIELFPGKIEEFMSFDEAIDDIHNYYEEEFLNSLLPNSVPPHRLCLKKDCPVILLRNLDPGNGLCNGTRMVCREFRKNIIYAEIATGQNAGKKVFLPRIPMSPANDEGYPFKFKRKQFPIRLCFAMTINKAQRQTIPNVGVYLPQDVFSHGQLYVALSRGVSMTTTKVLVKSKDLWTKNIVYKEVLNL